MVAVPSALKVKLVSARAARPLRLEAPWVPSAMIARLATSVVWLTAASEVALSCAVAVWLALGFAADEPVVPQPAGQARPAMVASARDRCMGGSPCGLRGSHGYRASPARLQGCRLRLTTRALRSGHGSA